jgi:hypothetical protein
MLSTYAVLRLHARRPSRARRRLPPRLEYLETRNLLSAGAGLDQVVAQPALHVTPQDGPGQSPFPGYSPAQIRHAYGFDQITFSNGTITGDGSGQTIAIVDAYDDPNVLSDLKAFDQQFNLPDPPSFTKAKQYIFGRGPSTNSGWALEISLDVEWAHAIAPGANILLVESYNSGLGNLLSAVDYARNQTGVATVSMSWGAGEFSTEANYDGYFTTPSGHSGVTFVAATGDDGGYYGVEWPSVSPNVVAVGGTSLTLADSNGTYGSESGWAYSNGGVSNVENEPSYQNNVQNTGARTTPDVAYNADPNTGFAVYDTVSYYGQKGWFEVGGTSAGAPQWAALIAIADQGRALANKGALNGTNDTLPALYNLSSSDFNDITSGSNAYFSAGPGYDLVTGIGTPVANLVVNDLVAVSGSQGPHSGSSGGGGSGSPGGTGGGHTMMGGSSSGSNQAGAADMPTPTVTDLSSEAATAISLVAISTPAPALVQAPTVFAPILTVQAQVGSSVVLARQTSILTPAYFGSGGDVSPDLGVLPNANGDRVLPASGEEAPRKPDQPPADRGSPSSDQSGMARAKPVRYEQTPQAKPAADFLFADRSAVAALADRTVSPAEGDGRSFGPALDPMAATATLGIVLGGYWGTQPKDSRRNRWGFGERWTS